MVHPDEKTKPIWIWIQFWSEMALKWLPNGMITSSLFKTTWTFYTLIQVANIKGQNEDEVSNFRWRGEFLSANTDIFKEFRSSGIVNRFLNRDDWRLNFRIHGECGTIQY